MKRVLALIICLLLAFAATSIVACNKDDSSSDNSGSNNSGSNSDAGHVHTYSMEGEWEKDAAGHWLDATCDCDDVPVYKRAHVDANNDNACDVCTYAIDAEHEHTHTEEWTADCTNHWNVPDCGHTGAPVANLAAHADADNDGECDVCKYVIEDLHNHYYSTEWTSGEGHHWHAALCEHGALITDKAACDVNAAGYCTICGAKVNDVDMEDLGAVLAAAVASNDKVVTGNVKLKETVYDGSEANNTLTVLNSAETGAFFVLGNGESFYFLKNYNGSGTLIGGEQQWFETLDNGEVYGVKMNVNSYELEPIMGDPAKLSGYTYLPGSILAAGYDDTNTLAQTLYNFYDLMTKGVNVYDEQTGYDAETGYYTFSFAYFTVNELTSGGEVYDIQLALYETQILFSINDDYVIDYAEFEVKVYNYYDGGKAENDLTYDKDSNTVTKTNSANPSYYNYIVHQTSGERTFTTPYPKESLIPHGFDFYYVTDHDFPNNSTEWVIYDENLLEDTLTLESGTYAYFRLGNPVPSTTNFNFIDTSDFTFTFVNNDPDSSKRAWYMDAGSVDEMLNGYSAYINCLKLKIRDAGEYTVTVGFGDLVKTFTLIVTAPPTTEITGDAEKIDVILTDFNTYTNDDQTYTYVAAEEGNYTFTVPAGLGARIDGESNPKVDLYDNGGSFTVGLNAGESVKIYFAAGEYKQFTVNVSYAYADIPDPIPEPEEPEIELGDITGTYIASGLTVVIDDEKVTFTTSRGGQTVCEYDIVDGAVVLYNSFTGAPWSSNLLAVNIANGAVSSVVYNGSSYTVTKEGAEEPDSGDEGDELEGTGTEEDPYILEATGDFVANFKGGMDLVWYAYTAKESGIITLTSSFSGTPWLNLGASTSTAASNEGYLTELSVFVPANGTVYIGVGDWNEAAGDVPFTVAFEAKASEDFSALVGTWYAASSTAWGGSVNYTLVINADGTGTLSYDMGYGETSYAVSYVFVEGQNVTIAFSGAYTAGELACTYNGTEFACLVGVLQDSFVFSTTPVEGGEGGEGGDDDEPTVETDPVKEALLGTYQANGYSVMLYNSAEGYLANIYTSDYSTDLYFTFDVTDNGDGTYTLALTYYSRPDYEVNVDAKDSILAQEWVISAAVDENVEGSAENPYTITEPGEFGCHYNGDYNFSYYKYEVLADGYITITVNSETPYFQYGTDINNMTNNEGPSGALSTKRFFVRAGQVAYFAIGNGELETAADVEFTVAFEEFTSESAAHLAGTWTGTESDMFGGSTNYTFTINADGTGTGSGDMGYWQDEYEITFILVDGNAVTIYAVTTGEWGGAPYMFEFTYDADAVSLSSDNLTLTKGGTTDPEPEPEPEPDPDPDPEEPTVGGSGTSADPYIVGELPFTFTHSGTYDVYYKFTATEDATIVISYPQGGMVSSLPSNAEKDSNAKTYTFTVVAGDVITFNPWTMTNAVDHVYVIKKADQVVTPEPDPEEPGEGGEEGGATGSVETYIGSGAGRGMKIIIDKTADTLVIVRAQGGSLTNFDGGTTYNLKYSEIYALAVDGVVPGFISGTSVQNLTFNEDGTVKSLMWNGVVYTDYVKQ